MPTALRESRRVEFPGWYVVVGSCLLGACAGSGTHQGPGRTPSRPAASAPVAAHVFAPGSISDSREQWRITFSRDGLTAYFASSEQFFPFSRKATIYVSRFSGSSWSTPDTATFSGKFSDVDPAFSPDGRRLYFASIRPVNGVVRGDLDIWMVEQSVRGWSDPVHLGAEVNSAGDELYPSAALDGSLYFASGPRAPAPGQHYDIYRASPLTTPRSAPYGATPRRPRFSDGEPLGEAVNRAPRAGDPNLQSAWDFNPEISADGTTLIFTSLRPGGHGLGDLYVSHLIGGKWSPALNLGPAVNTDADEYHPTLSRDREWLYFVRRGPNPGDFYRIPVRMLPALLQSKTGGVRDAELR